MLETIKRSIFKGKEQDDGNEKGGVLAVWGSPGSGKSVTAVKIAQYLAQQNLSVILLLCDATAPMLPCICPVGELECERSLKTVLCANYVSKVMLENNLCIHKRLPNLSMLGMLKNENQHHVAYTPEHAENLIKCLRQLAKYVVIDCSSYFAYDELSSTALFKADYVLRLANADLKSISYLSSQLPLLKENGWNAEKQFKAANNFGSCYENSPANQALGKAEYTLPHSAELESQYRSGSLLDELRARESLPYRREIEKICAEVFKG